MIQRADVLEAIDTLKHYKTDLESKICTAIRQVIDDAVLKPDSLRVEYYPIDEIGTLNTKFYHIGVKVNE